MLQLPVIVVLMVSICVGRVSPMLSDKEGHEKGEMNVPVEVKNVTDAVNNSNIQEDKPLINKADDKKGNGNEGNVTELSKISPGVSAPTTPASVQKAVENNKQNCTSTEEQDDMLKCNVTPKDEDPAIEQNLPNRTEPTTIPTTITKKTAESQVPQVTPKDKESDEKENVELAINTTKTADQVHYKVVTPKPDRIVNTNHSDTLNTDTNVTNVTNVTNTTSVINVTNADEVSTVSPLLGAKIVTSTETAEVIVPKKSVSQIKNKRMSPGIIALVTAITFAVAIGSVYIGMIVWRRYTEYRYGHRELLVNELEFDTNDLRHFEL